MKKLISLILVLAISVMSLGLTAFAYTGHVNNGGAPGFNGATADNAFGDLIDWTGIVFGDASNIIDLEGTLAVGGSFESSRGLSINNGAYGANPVPTDDVALLVNGDINIAGYGSVIGQTVVGSAVTYRLSNIMASGSTNGQYTVADSSNYFADAKNTANAVKLAINALPVNGTCEESGGIYTFVGDPDADTLVYNVDGAQIASYRFDFNIEDGQTIIVNLTSADAINLSNGGVSINGSMDPDYLRGFNRNIIINVVRSEEITMNSCELYGILLAPDAVLTGSNSNVCGTSILSGLVGLNGFELHVGYNNNFIPGIPASGSGEGSGEGSDALPSESTIRIDVPLKMAVAFSDGSVYYGGEMKEVVVGEEYTFQMCAVNWENGLLDDNGNGLRGTVVYRLKVVHQDEFNALAEAAKGDPDRYIVKGIDIIDLVEKMIIVNCDAEDAHLETDVNSFFVAYRFHFSGEDYDKKTGIDHVINTPIESLSVNLPAGTTITCNAYVYGEHVGSDDVFITTNSGEGEYDDVYLTSVNDYYWNY